MQTNHPWSSKSRIFTCPPDCPKRQPGCHDHCETHIREKAEHERIRKAMRLEKYIDGYSLNAIMDKRDIAAKRSKSNTRFKRAFD